MRFDYFNEAELEQMHGATVEILTRIGISTSSDRFKGLLLDNGCKEQGDRILFTEEVIEKALKTVPSISIFTVGMGVTLLSKWASRRRIHRLV